MERVLVRAAVRLRVHELVDYVSEFENGAGPAVGKDHGKSVWVFGLDVQEIDFHAVNGRCELRVRVEQGFAAPPIICRLPVLA
jgi:hypothetical protein